jgi:predicted HD superfamily hydrolase involved in NAD metabolism
MILHERYCGEEMDDKKIVAQLSKILSPRRLEHSIGVSHTADIMAEQFGCNRVKAKMAGLLHDMAREIPVEEFLPRAQAFGIVVNDIERAEPILLHAPLAAKLAETRFQIHDVEILQAISWHTTGRSQMSMLDKIIYLADVIEPSRNFEGLEEIRTMAHCDLDKALLLALDQSISYILKRRGLIHPATIEARNNLLIQARRLIVRTT